MKFKSFEELLSVNAQKYPENVALAFAENDSIATMTYKELFDAILARKAELEDVNANCVGILQAPSKNGL